MRKLLRRFGLRVVILAAIALGIAQLGALAHGYSHGAGTNDSAAHDYGAAGHEPCSDCLSYSPLLSAAGASTPLPAIEPQGRGLSTRAAACSQVERRRILAFRSRAPPAAR